VRWVARATRAFQLGHGRCKMRGGLHYDPSTGQTNVTLCTPVTFNLGQQKEQPDSREGEGERSLHAATSLS